ncbi:MAG: hypothetical protein LIO57_08325 [Oscillospiraceae bacterium]|nr:hypothetical protein [Oscillospiraceae bacterium]
MAKQTTAEMLVEQAREAERLRLLTLVKECKTLEELEQKLRAMIGEEA